MQGCSQVGGILPTTPFVADKHRPNDPRQCRPEAIRTDSLKYFFAAHSRRNLPFEGRFSTFKRLNLKHKPY